MNIKLKIFYLTFFIASIGLSKTYYIDSIIGSDSNSGLNPKFPWKTIEKINTHNFVPGDSLLFRTGLKWRGELNIKGIGTESKPIIISSYGTGIKPVIMGSEIAGKWEKIFQNIIVSNFKQNPGCIWFTKSDSIYWGTKKESLNELENEFDYFWQDSKLYAYFTKQLSIKDFVIECSVRDFGIISGWYNNRVDYLNIENIEICFTKNANIRAIGTEGLKVTNCNLHHSGNKNESDGQGIQFEGKGGEFSANLIYENGQHGIFVSSFGNSRVRDIIIEKNTLFNNHHTGIDLMNDGGGENSLSNVTIRKNRIFDTNDFIGNEIGIQTLGYGEGTVKNIEIHHNILYDIKGIGISVMQNSDSIYVHNNAIVNTSSACININNADLYSEVINNISQNSNYYAVGFLHSKENKFIDNNIWYSEDKTITKNIFVTDIYFTNIDEYRNYTGFDRNGEFLDPKIDYLNNFPLCIKATSFCIDNAKSLGYTSDFHGNVIMNSPDIGACEFND